MSLNVELDHSHLEYIEAICALNHARLSVVHISLLQLFYPGDSAPAAPQYANDPDLLRAADAGCSPRREASVHEEVARYATARAAARDAALRSKLTLDEREAIDEPLCDDYRREATEIGKMIKAASGWGVCAKSAAFSELVRLQEIDFDAPR